MELVRRFLLARLGLLQGAAFRGSSLPRRRRPTRRRPAPPPHPLSAEYLCVGAPIGSDLATVRRCWRRRLLQTHPDRFPPDPEIQRRAAERLRRLNEAYARLRAELSGP